MEKLYVITLAAGAATAAILIGGYTISETTKPRGDQPTVEVFAKKAYKNLDGEIVPGYVMFTEYGRGFAYKCKDEHFDGNLDYIGLRDSGRFRTISRDSPEFNQYAPECERIRKIASGDGGSEYIGRWRLRVK